MYFIIQTTLTAPLYIIKSEYIDNNTLLDESWKQSLITTRQNLGKIP